MKQMWAGAQEVWQAGPVGFGANSSEPPALEQDVTDLLRGPSADLQLLPGY